MGSIMETIMGHELEIILAIISGILAWVNRQQSLRMGELRKDLHKKADEIIAILINPPPKEPKVIKPDLSPDKKKETEETEQEKTG